MANRFEQPEELAVQRRFMVRDEEVTIEDEREGDGWRVRLPDGSVHSITARRLVGGTIEVTRTAPAGSTTQTFRAQVARTERGIEVGWGGDAYVFAPADERKAAKRAHSSGTLTSPMSGIVVEVMVTPGQVVNAYEPLAVVEAMKVMATVEAPFAGTVSAVFAREGVRVDQGDTLVELAPFDES